MNTATLLLLSIGFLGALDIAYFHCFRSQLVLRAESHREAWIHVARGVCYAVQFLVVPNVQLRGAWYLPFLALFVVDCAIAAMDVLEEPRSRAAQGGLSGGEYLMHITLSVLVGAYLCAVFGSSWHWASEPTALVLDAGVAPGLRAAATVMAVGSLVTALAEALVLLEQRLGPARPIHVRVRLAASLEQVWNLTQDYRVHPEWDHRFSRIVMCHEEGAASPPAPVGVPDPRIRTGTLMRYEKHLLGATVRGHGRYKVHRPMQQSTFEFWSDDPRSLIRRGVGLWRYTDLRDGRVEFATSYTYEVRWGIFGRVVDRFMFRPLLQRLTEQSFRRLAKRYFGEPRPRVLGRAGRLPQRFEPAGALA